MATLFDELATGASRAEGTPDWDGGASSGRVQNVSDLLARLPVGPAPSLVNGRVRFLQAGAPRTLRITDAFVTEDDAATGRLHLTLDGVAEIGDSADVAVLWPGA